MSACPQFTVIEYTQFNEKHPVGAGHPLNNAPFPFDINKVSPGKAELWEDSGNRTRIISFEG